MRNLFAFRDCHAIYAITRLPQTPSPHKPTGNSLLRGSPVEINIQPVLLLNFAVNGLAIAFAGQVDFGTPAARSANGRTSPNFSLWLSAKSPLGAFL
jgi:hypothetical protein